MSACNMSDLLRETFQCSSDLYLTLTESQLICVHTDGFYNYHPNYMNLTGNCNFLERLLSRK